jgi:hypothetical protein
MQGPGAAAYAVATTTRQILLHASLALPLPYSFVASFPGFVA